MNERQAGGGIGIGGALLVLFVALKLTGVITWSWWWVLAPVWIPFGLMLLVLAGFAGWWVLLSRGEDRERERRRTSVRGPAAHEHGPAHRWGRRGQ